MHSLGEPAARGNTMSGTYIRGAKVIMDFVDGHIEEEGSSFDIEGIDDPRVAIVTVVCNGTDLETHAVVETAVGPSPDWLADTIAEWMACLRWVKTFTGCILTQDEIEAGDWEPHSLTVKDYDFQHVRDILADHAKIKVVQTVDDQVINLMVHHSVNLEDVLGGYRHYVQDEGGE